MFSPFWAFVAFLISKFTAEIQSWVEQRILTTRSICSNRGDKRKMVLSAIKYRSKYNPLALTPLDMKEVTPFFCSSLEIVGLLAVATGLKCHSEAS